MTPVAVTDANTGSTTRRMISLAETAALLRDADNILIASHLRPDGDCVGSSVALMLVLEKLGKRVAAYNRDKLGPKLSFLAGAERIVQSKPSWKPDWTVFVDCGGVKRVSDDFEPTGTTVNIDHHITNDCFAEYNFIDAESASVGEQIYKIMLALGVTITPQMASAMYLSLMGDTGGFRYSNTTHHTLDLAATLARAGASPSDIATAYYESRDPGEIMLTGKALARITREMGGKLAWSELTIADYDEAGGDDVEPDGLVNEMRQIQGVDVAMLIHETRDGFLRVGFRSKADVDVATIARECGGGGHLNAAGARYDKAPFREAREYVLATTRRHLERYYAAKGAAGR